MPETDTADNLTGTLELSSCRIDLGDQVVISGAQRQPLETLEAQLLAYLAVRPGQVVPQDELYTQAWGYAPGRSQTDIDHTIQSLRAKLEVDPAHPQHLFSLVGQGYRLDPLTPSPQSSTSLLSTNLTAQAVPILGRDQDIAAVENLLAEGHRMITVLGTGGLGKTRLAQEVAQRAATAGAYTGGAWFCDLVECRSFRDILHTVSSALSIRLERTDDPIASAQALGRAIGTRGRLLIILDNFEQVLEFAPQTLAAWHMLAESAHFLVTSRQSLALPAEQAYTLEPLSLQAGCTLFESRARAVNPDLPMTGEQQQTISQIVEQLQRIPLAILLAASRSASITLNQIHTDLAQRLQFSRQSTRISDARQATMRAAIDWSWDHLDEVCQSVLRQCAVFRSGFTLEAAEAVIELPEGMDDPPWLEDVLKALTEQSMLHVQQAPERALDHRICAFDNIRYYALEKLEREVGLEAARRRHAAYFEHWSAGQVEGLDHPLAYRCLHRLRYEIDNLITALQTALPDNPSQAMTLAVAIDRVYFSNGWLQGNVEILDTLLPHQEGLSLDEQCTLHHLRSRSHHAQGHGEAEQAATQALQALIAEHPEHPKHTSVLLSTVNQMLRDGHTEEALRDLTDWLDQRPNLTAGEQCSVHAKLGLVHFARQDLMNSAAHLQKAIDLGPGAVDQGWCSGIRANLGALFIALGEIDRGQTYLEQALTDHERFGNRMSAAIALVNLAGADLRKRAPQTAAVRLQRAVALLRDCPRVSVRVETLLMLATAHAIVGEDALAWEVIDQAQEVAHDQPLYLALSLALRAALVAAAGDHEQATTLWAEAQPAITPSAVLCDAQWAQLGQAHLDLSLAAKLIKRDIFRVPRHPSHLPLDILPGKQYHHLHILLLEARCAQR